LVGIMYLKSTKTRKKQIKRIVEKMIRIVLRA
jgi:hypothetical protein